MTEDIIVDETAEFIRSSETNLKLALQVERAMPSVREHYVRVALDAVKKEFRPREWIIDEAETQDVMSKDAILGFRRKAWRTNRSAPGIWLSSDKPNWESVWIGVSFTGESSGKVRSIEQTVARLVGHGFWPLTSDESGAYKYLNEELRDWSGERFLTKIAEENGPDQIASEICAELKKIDEITRPLLR